MSEPIRVAYVMGRGVIGGVERHVQSIANNLDRDSFTPVVITLMQGGEIIDQLAAEGVEVSVLGGGSGRDLRLIGRLRCALKSLRADIVHSHELHSSLGACLWTFPRLPWIHTEHCSFDHGPSPGKARLLWRLFTPRMQQILAVSQATALSLHRNTSIALSRIDTNYNGIDLSVLPPKDPNYLRRELHLPAETKLIGSVGRLVAQKGWDDFLEMVRRIVDLRSDCHFAIVGNGPDGLALVGRAKAMGLSDRCHFLNVREDAVSIIGGFDLFILASRHEELPTTLLEAFAMKTPVAGFIPEGGVSEILALTSESAGSFVEPRNPIDLAQMVHELLNDPDRCARQAASAFKLVHTHFSMAERVQTLEQYYRSVYEYAAPRRR